MDEKQEQTEQTEQQMTPAEQLAAQEAALAALRQELEQERRQGVEQRAVEGLRFSSKSARAAFLTRLRAEQLPMEQGTLGGLAEFIAQYRGEDPAAFGAAELPRVVEATPGGGGTSRQQFAAMSYSQRLKLRQENPQRYRELAEQ